ncbi:MAG: hypothetical protein L7U56_01615, partial [Acidimicrobiales bacterium]|nr:hypothetical protein [Acidimicrobiales bacterium]
MLADPYGCRKILGPKATGALFDETGQQAVRRNLDLMTQLRDLPIDLDASVLTGNAADHQQVCADIGHPKLAARVSAALLNVSAAAAADQEIEALAEADLRYSDGYRDALDDLDEMYGDEFDETAAPVSLEPETVPFAAAGSTNRQSSGQLDLF